MKIMMFFNDECHKGTKYYNNDIDFDYRFFSFKYNIDCVPRKGDNILIDINSNNLQEFVTGEDNLHDKTYDYMKSILEKHMDEVNFKDPEFIVEKVQWFFMDNPWVLITLSPIKR
ncbi:hypothetical protein SAMN04489761_3435 [Tenacibaculum sp. MAR_2009_124]|uniref:hypothetical protein n=1 Tax=Tenacibaculum sp. MAR_2009_124 TaxID=1250059 RepID=UPI00089746D2|nr:hypothetical protein [Tenacibaculum sp. MAR_2009_124]SEC66325.1 hypothetical protein SAMN04489761_3435 [Tenacibaculum sp. MAR_2009_124]